MLLDVPLKSGLLHFSFSNRRDPMLFHMMNPPLLTAFLSFFFCNLLFFKWHSRQYFNRTFISDSRRRQLTVIAFCEVFSCSFPFYRKLHIFSSLVEASLTDVPDKAGFALEFPSKTSVVVVSSYVHFSQVVVLQPKTVICKQLFVSVVLISCQLQHLFVKNNSLLVVFL